MDDRSPRLTKREWVASIIERLRALRANELRFALGSVMPVDEVIRRLPGAPLTALHEIEHTLAVAERADDEERAEENAAADEVEPGRIEQVSGRFRGRW